MCIASLFALLPFSSGYSRHKLVQLHKWSCRSWVHANRFVTPGLDPPPHPPAPPSHVTPRWSPIKVQVMDDFPYKGEPAGLVLARLGLPQDTLIKIRRKISPGILRQMSQSLEENASLGFPTPALYSSSVKEGATHDEQDANAIMEVNQKTFRAECMYSYRMRAECLWGTKDDLAQEEKCISPLAGTAVADASGSEARKPGRFSRKRWVSDADAQRSSKAIAAVNGNNATPNGNASATAAGNGAAGQGHPNGGSLNAEGETYTDIFPVSAAEPVQAGDVLFLSCAQAREAVCDACRIITAVVASSVF